MNELINELMSGEGDCRTAPATPGLLNTLNLYLLCVTISLKPMEVCYRRNQESFCASPWLPLAPNIIPLQLC